MGLYAGISNLVRNYEGLTLAGLVHKYAPANGPGNSAVTESSYVQDLSRRTGLSPSSVPDLRDAAQLQSLVPAIISHENGQQPFDPNVIAQAIRDVLKDAPQKVHVTVTAPNGASTAVSVNGQAAPVRAGYTMDGR